MTKKVIATRLGFYDGARRRQGETFEVAKNATGSWFKEVETKAPPKKADQAKK